MSGFTRLLFQNFFLVGKYLSFIFNLKKIIIVLAMLYPNFCMPFEKCQHLSVGCLLDLFGRSMQVSVSKNPKFYYTCTHMNLRH